MPTNLNEVPDGNFIECAGVQDLCVVKVEENIVSQKKGTPGFCITLTNAQGQTIRDTFWDVQNAMFRQKLVAKAAQLTTEQMEVFVPSMLKGKTMTCTIVPDGEKYVKVGKYEPTGTIVIPPIDSDDTPF